MFAPIARMATASHSARGWPNYDGADTKIFLSSEHIYEVPSNLLRAGIGHFHRILTNETSRDNCQDAILWTLELDLVGKQWHEGTFVIKVNLAHLHRRLIS